MGKKIQMRFGKRRSLLQKVLIVAGILVVLLGVFYFSFRLKNIEIDDCAYYTKEELVKYMKKDGWDNNTVLFYLRNKDKKQSEIPFIQKLVVKYQDRNSVKIRIYEKPIIGCIEYMNEYIYFDKDGKVLEISSKRMKDIPLYSGISFKKMSLYDTLAVENTDIFKKILDISQLIEKDRIPIERVVFDSEENVTLYYKNIKVLLGNRTTYDDPMAELVNILPKLKKLKGELDMKTFKSGQSSIIFKETK